MGKIIPQISNPNNRQSKVASVRISDEITIPAYTDIYGMARSGWIWYANEFFPSLTDTKLEQHHTWAQTTRHEMSSDFMLKILWNNNLW